VVGLQIKKWHVHTVRGDAMLDRHGIGPVPGGAFHLSNLLRGPVRMPDRAGRISDNG